METPIATLTCFLGVLFIMTSAMLATSMRIVPEDTRLSVYRLGRYIGDKGPGLVLLIPVIDRGVRKELGGVERTPSRRYVGAVGEALTPVFRDGRVSFSGEEWEAVSQAPIAAGRRVRVTRVLLEVEEES